MHYRIALCGDDYWVQALPAAQDDTLSYRFVVYGNKFSRHKQREMGAGTACRVLGAGTARRREPPLSPASRELSHRASLRVGSPLFQSAAVFSLPCAKVGASAVTLPTAKFTGGPPLAVEGLFFVL